MSERLSAVIDGEVEQIECEACLNGLARDADQRDTWGVYHLIGDALRGEAGTSLPAAFAERLATEPTVLAPRRAERTAARGRWRVLSAAASVAAVALVAWMALPQMGPPAQIASAPAPLPVAVQTVAAVVPPAQGVNDYLLAHQRFSPSSTIGGMAPYIRTVSEPGGTR